MCFNQDEKLSRKLGVTIRTLMYRNRVSCEELSHILKYSYRDMCRIIDSRLMLSPTDLKKIAGAFGITKEELIHYELPDNIPKFKYMNEFENSDSLNKIFNLMDNYIELIESE